MVGGQQQRRFQIVEPLTVKRCAGADFCHARRIGRAAEHGMKTDKGIHGAGKEQAEYQQVFE